MQQLSPNETITINRILKDTSDTGTNYVQAIVYNSDTRAVLETLNLTDNGSRWFSKTYQAPYDNIYMRGRRILIITTVYSDSGYTTVNPNYNQESDEYLIQERWNPATNTNYGGLAGGVEIDYKKVREILKEELKNIEFPEQEKPETPQKIDTEAIIQEITRDISAKIDSAVGGIPTPEAPEKVDLRSIENKISDLALEVKKLPKFERTDLTEIVRGLQDLKETVGEVTPEVKTLVNEALQDIKNVVVPYSEETSKQRFIQGIKDGSIEISLQKSEGDKKKDSYLKNLMAKYQ